jgi:hypothetical protein
MSYSGKNFDLMQIEIKNDLQILDQWAKTWLVDFNPKKTKALIISNNTNIPELNIRFLTSKFCQTCYNSCRF